MNTLAAAYSPWIELAVVLTVGPVLIVAFALLADRLAHRAVWRRTLWQATVAAVALLVAVEITGLGHGVGNLVTASLVVRPTLEAEAELPVAKDEKAQNTIHRPRGVGNERAATDAATSSETRHPASLDETQHGEGEAPAEPQRRSETTAQQELRPPVSPDRHSLEGQTKLAGSPFTPSVPVVLSDPAYDWSKSPHDAAITSGTESITNQESATTIASRSQTEPQPLSAHVALWPAAVWGVGGLLVLSFVVASQLSLVRFRRRMRMLDNAVLRRRIEELTERIGFRSTVRLMESSQVTTPVAFGAFTPTLVLPPKFMGEFGAVEQQAMLAHELAHLAARDSAWHLSARLVCAALWWQPAVWLLQRRLQVASEAAADEASLVVPDGPRHLAECLVEMGRRLTSPRRVAWLQVTGEGYRSDLGKRVVRLLGLERTKWRRPRRLQNGLAKSGVVFLLLITVVCCTAWVRPQAASREGETTMTLFKSGWGRSLASVALLTLWGSAGDASADQPQPDPSLTDTDMTVALLAEDEEEEREARRDRERDEEEEERDVRRERERDEEEEREARHREREEREERAERERERDREHHGREREHHGREMDREKVLHNLMREREEVMERGHHLKRELEKLPDSADEEAAKIQAELRRLAEMLRRIDAHAREIKGGEHAERDRPRPEQGHRGDLERRLHHLHVAIENLKAAGMHEAAEHLMREGERLKRELGEGHEHHGEHRHEHHGEAHDHERPRPEHRPERPSHPDQSERVIHEMRQQMEQMRRQMAEMQQAIRMLMERERRDER